MTEPPNGTRSTPVTLVYMLLVTPAGSAIVRVDEPLVQVLPDWAACGRALWQSTQPRPPPVPLPTSVYAPVEFGTMVSPILWAAIVLPLP